VLSARKVVISLQESYSLLLQWPAEYQSAVVDSPVRAATAETSEVCLSYPKFTVDISRRSSTVQNANTGFCFVNLECHIEERRMLGNIAASQWVPIRKSHQNSGFCLFQLNDAMRVDGEDVAVKGTFLQSYR